MSSISPTRSIRWAAATVAAALVIGAIAGCSSTPTAATKQDVTLNVWSFQPSLDNSLNVIFNNFHKAHPDVSVNLKSIAYKDYVPQLQAALQAGNEPELYMPATLTLQLAEAGKVEDFRKVLGSKFIGDFYESTNQQNAYKGGEYAIPVAASMTGMFYNKTMFAANGWSIPETWSDLEALVPKIRAKGITPVAITGNQASALSDFTWPIITQEADSTALAYALDAHTAKSATWTNPQVISAFSKVRELVNAGVFDPGVLGVDIDAAQASFLNGKAAMYTASSNWYPTLKQSSPDFVSKNLGVFPTPSLKKGARHWSADQAGYTLSMKAGMTKAQKTAATELVKYLYTPSRYQDWINSVGLLPATKDSVDSITIPIMKTYAKWLLEGDGAPHIAYGVGTGDAIGTAASALFGKQGTPKEIAQQAEDSVVAARSR